MIHKLEGGTLSIEFPGWDVGEQSCNQKTVLYKFIQQSRASAADNLAIPDDLGLRLPEPTLNITLDHILIE
jgi:hypothetical protein